MNGNTCDDVFDWAARDPDRAMFSAKADGAWQPVTAKQIADRVTAVAAGLIAAGIQPGDRDRPDVGLQLGLGGVRLRDLGGWSRDRPCLRDLVGGADPLDPGRFGRGRRVRGRRAVRRGHRGCAGGEGRGGVADRRRRPGRAGQDRGRRHRRGDRPPPRRGDRVDARDPRVHVGHGRPAEGLHDQPRQPDRGGPRHYGRARGPRACADGGLLQLVLPAPVAHLGPGGRPVPGARGQADRFPLRSWRAARGTRRVPAHDPARGAPGVREGGGRCPRTGRSRGSPAAVRRHRGRRDRLQPGRSSGRRAPAAAARCIRPAGLRAAARRWEARRPGRSAAARR
jgi:hypothetical protein